ncbi:E3 ubiquitin-protein ligase RNF115 [Odontesthes bonariensis]|uniref:E3 ubiquitin-protein ligase RNF115 n=1 Tax=Odontesthes bonariensis TaxID=219752 RepID=UPI003F58F0AF
MAEAADTPHRFYCHCCKRETNPKLPDLVCPTCGSDFIEETTENSSLLQGSPPSVAGEASNSLLSELWQLVFMERSALLSHPPSSASDPEDSEQVSESSPSPELPVVEAEEQVSPRPEQRPATEGMVQQFLAGLFISNGNPGAAPAALSGMLQLHSNPGDYAWGQGGLDAVITELLGQLENTGPPPAEKEMISSLPVVCVSQDQTDCRLGCPVCREEYSLGESVRKLPCLHHFHNECIVPWLELHDTCPVCRKSLNGVDNSLLSTSEPPEVPRSVRQEQQERQAI